MDQGENDWLVSCIPTATCQMSGFNPVLGRADSSWDVGSLTTDDCHLALIRPINIQYPWSAPWWTILLSGGLESAERDWFIERIHGNNFRCNPKAVTHSRLWWFRAHDYVIYDPVHSDNVRRPKLHWLNIAYMIQKIYRITLLIKHNTFSLF